MQPNCRMAHRGSCIIIYFQSPDELWGLDWIVSLEPTRSKGLRREKTRGYFTEFLQSSDKDQLG
ncbi:hypothetical protein FOQG_14619 [Fusarium oxysporum f. sp. raphani 54005]|uniref:Uncharacterized protein n=2 Tax=Fusarium oxysporum TaxID=5507 RepID=X0BGI7_FUSOX|nr:hypothetical protein FOVG_16514 [Fusarium oxysporum f. sp. pisi HDV247]EXK80931.1 hypothetical protein FOQG_14619 [Fusarium oxysporum f. sp. raphani 54005]